MDNGIALVFLPVFINRVTETIKRAFLDKLSWSDDAKGALVLFVSLVLGAAGVVLVFPGFNLIAGQGASPLAEQIVSGIILGGLANGIDFLGGKLSEQPSKSSTITATASDSSGKVTATVS